MSSRIHVKSLMSVWHSSCGTAFILVGTLIICLCLPFSLNLEQLQMVETCVTFGGDGPEVIDG